MLPETVPGEVAGELVRFRLYQAWKRLSSLRSELSVRLTGPPEVARLLVPEAVNDWSSWILRIRPEITSGFQWAEGPHGSSTWVDSCRRQFLFSS